MFKAPYRALLVVFGAVALAVSVVALNPRTEVVETAAPPSVAQERPVSGSPQAKDSLDMDDWTVIDEGILGFVLRLPSVGEMRTYQGSCDPQWHGDGGCVKGRLGAMHVSTKRFSYGEAGAAGHSVLSPIIEVHQGRALFDDPTKVGRGKAADYELRKLSDAVSAKVRISEERYRVEQTEHGQMYFGPPQPVLIAYSENTDRTTVVEFRSEYGLSEDLDALILGVIDHLWIY